MKKTIFSGPGTSSSAPYVPVACQLMDDLEWLVRSGTPIRVWFRDSEDCPRETQGVPQDLLTKDKEEFLVIGEVRIRLDRISRVQTV